MGRRIRPCLPTWALALFALGCANTGTTDPARQGNSAELLLARSGYGDWSEPVNLGDSINSAAPDQGPGISTDELTLYFASTRTEGGFGGNDIWVSRRRSRADQWGPARNLGPVINTSAVESTPTLSRDGHRLYFASLRPGGAGIDLWVSERANTSDDLGWGPPVNLGPAINSSAADLGPTLFTDPETGRLTLYFYSTRPGPAGSGARDIYRSTADEHGQFAPAVLVPELSTPFEDEQPTIRRDGLEIFFASNRPGSSSTTPTDIWESTRASTSDPWSEPRNLGPVINTPGLEARPALSFDATRLYFFSSGHGGFGATDLFVSTRRRLDDEGAHR